MSVEFYDRQYNPRLSIPNALDYFQRWQSDGERSRATGSARWDLKYGESDDETLDFYPAKGTSPALLIFIHGGYWRAMHKNDFAWLASPFVEQGISVANLNYTLVPQISLGELVTQVRSAVAWLYENQADLGFDRSRVVCAGHSAGGHLAAMLLTSSGPTGSGVKGEAPFVVALSGLFDLGPLLQASFLSDVIQLTDNQIHQLSPANLTPSTGSRVLTVVGELESDEFHRQSELLAERWGDGVVTANMVVAGANHFDVCDVLADSNSELFQTVCATCRG